MSNRRQLSAIMFTDIEGYTAIMQQDELKARVIRNKLHETLDRNCKMYNGRIIQSSGDGALCIFDSSIEAVRAAISIQNEMNLEPKVPLRIGIHSGDIVFDGSQIYGDGVNIASRIESFAVAGGVFVSGRIYDDIKNQNDIRVFSFGLFELKNIKSPMEIFAICNQGLMVPANLSVSGKGKKIGNRIRMAKIILLYAAITIIIASLCLLLIKQFHNQNNFQQHSKTIAILPFTNLSKLADDEYYADGVYNEILTQISKIGGVNVMSRTTMLQYKNTRKTIRQISNEIGADVLLEGTVQKSGNKLRITVQLMDAKEDRHLWAETYDRDLNDIFVIQTNIAKEVAVALNTTLTDKEKSLFDEVPTTNLKAYDFYLKGNKYATSYWDYSRLDEVDEAIRMYDQAISIDPKFTAAYDALIELYLGISWDKPMLNSDEYRNKAKQWLDKMLVLNIDDVYTHKAIANYRYKSERDYENAMNELNIIDRKLGNGKSTYMLRADLLRREGRIDESLEYLKKQCELFPKVGRLWIELAETYKLKREFDSCVKYVNKAIEIGPDISGYYIIKSMYYAELKGDLETASLILQSASSLVDTNDFKSDVAYFEMLKGNYDHAIQLVSHSSDSMGILWQYKFVPNDLFLALMYLAQGKKDLARSHFQKTYDLSYSLIRNYPDDFRLHATLGIASAGLGKREIALKEGILARDLMPFSKDAILGISPLESLALIYVLLDEQDEAVNLLKQLLKMPFSWTMSNSIPLYRIHYYWKSLHSNARFREMIQSI